MSKYAKRVLKTKNTFASIITSTALRVIAATASYESRTTEITEVPAARESIRQEGK
ncbi:3149_t:CDS:1, partial [Racocetra persica]